MFFFLVNVWRVFLPHRGVAFKTTILLGSVPRVDVDKVWAGAGTTRGSARRSQEHPVGGRTRRWASPRQDGDPASYLGGGDPKAAASIADCRRPHCHC